MLLQTLFDTEMLAPCFLGFLTGAFVMLFMARSVLKQKNKRISNLVNKLKDLEESNMNLLEDMGTLKQFINLKEHSI